MDRPLVRLLARLIVTVTLAAATATVAYFVLFTSPTGWWATTHGQQVTGWDRPAR